MYDPHRGQGCCTMHCIQIASSLSVLLLHSMELNIIEVAYEIVEVRDPMHFGVELF